MLDGAAHVEEYPDCTLVPGLIDAHCHITLSADSRSYEEMALDSDELMALVAVRNVGLHLSAGVTTLRDNGGRNLVPFTVREAIERGYVQGPRLLLSGRPVTPSGGHFHWCNGVADGRDQIVALVRTLVSEGADHIKIMASGGGTAGTSAHLPSYSVDELRAAIDAAHDLERLTTCHCRARDSMLNALSAQTDCIEHAEFLVRGPEVAFGGGVRSSVSTEYDRRVVERMLARDVYLSATLQPGYDSLLALRTQREELSMRSRGQLSYLESLHDTKLAVVQRLLADGMRDHLIVSTDAGPGDVSFGGLQRAMRVAVEAGMTPAQAIDATTIIPARACNLSQHIGSIAVGKDADMVLVRGTAFSEIAHMENVVAVYVAGQRVGGPSGEISNCSVSLDRHDLGRVR